MASNIRGITVEIDGNTKKLTQALKDTGKETKSISAELAQVEKLLKVDPSNTELLAQKQGLLAQAIEATRGRLDILHQVQEKFEKGFAANDAWETAYEPLRLEIEETSAAMDRMSQKLKQAQMDLEAGTISTEAYEALEAQFEALEERSKELAKAKGELDAQFEDGHISGEEYRKYRRDVAATTQELDKLEQQLADNEKSLDQLAQTAQEGENSLDRLTQAAQDGERGLDRLTQAAQEGENGLDRLSQTAKQASDAFGDFEAVAAPFSKAAAGIITAAVAAAESTEELRTDLSVLDNNARMAGVGVESANEAFRTLNVVTGEADSSIEAVSNLLAAGFSGQNWMTAELESTSQSIRQLEAQMGVMREKLEKGEISTQQYDAFNLKLQETRQRYEELKLSANDFTAQAELDQRVVEGLANAALTFRDTIKVESLADSLQETLASGSAVGQFAEVLDRIGYGAENFTDQMAQCRTEVEKQQLALSVLTQGPLRGVYQSWMENNEALVESKQAHIDMQMAMALVGEAVQPLISSGLGVLADILSRIAGAFSSLSPETQAFIVKLLMLTATLAPILKMVSSIFGAIDNVNKGMGAISEIADKFSSGAGNTTYRTFLKWAVIIAAVVFLITQLITAISVLTGKGEQMSSAMDSLGGSMSGVTGSFQGANIPQYASGTDNHPGGLALVGEQGAELLSLPRGSRVYSNSETMRLLEPAQGQPAATEDRELLQALDQGFDRVVRAVQEKDMNTYLDGTRMSRSMGKKQEWFSQTQGPSLVKG